MPTQMIENPTQQAASSGRLVCAHGDLPVRAASLRLVEGGGLGRVHLEERFPCPTEMVTAQ